jgi:hypothetical protein
MRKALAALFLVPLLLLTACGKPLPNEGFVTAHDYSAPWVQMICTSYHKDGWCQMQMPVQHPARWRLLVDPNLREEDDAVWVAFDTNVHEQYPIGSVWRNPNPSEG